MTSKKPIYEQLRLLAIERRLIAQRAFEEEMYNSAIGDYHMAVELIMKSAVYKNGGTPPASSRRGHDLVEISISMLPDMENLHTSILSSGNTEKWTNINSAWDTGKRYQYFEFDPLDADEFATSYERIFEWVLTNFVE
jgi:HEPN domain-containing protein